MGTLMSREQKELAYRNALIYTNYACSMSCKRCFLKMKGPRSGHSLTYDEFCRFCERCKEQGITLNVMCFTGGEPTLWPHLIRAISYAKAKAVAKVIRVVTNGVDRHLEDYGMADVVHVSGYGAENRLDIQRLMKQRHRGGPKVRFQMTVHLPWPFPDHMCGPQNLPGDCGCTNIALVGDGVYRCGLAAGLETGDKIPVEEDFYLKLCDGRPHMQELCMSCISNRKLKKQMMADTTFEWGFWDSPVCGIVSLGAKMMWLRKQYSNFFRWRLRHGG